AARALAPLAPLAPIAASALIASGCTTDFFVGQIVATPNYHRAIDTTPEADRREREWMKSDSFLRVPVGPPEASLGAWIFEPPAPPLGTILVLHGIADGPFWMRDKARALAKHGYRAVLVGLRGYGASSGDFRGFGVIEREDLVQVVDEIDRRGLLDGPLGVWGMSYGGAVAIMYAGHDPRVRAVVTVGAFASMRMAVPHTLELFFPIPGLLMSESEQDRLVAMAAAIAGFSANDAAAEVAIAKTSAPVLLVHGDWDWIVPYENGERLHAAAPDHSELVRLPATGHFGSYWDVGGEVERRSFEWFDRHLAAPAPGAASP
ncbi:MAG: alpha/beta fold hydrolase, partial [Phycisphaerae bacterium]|nr:alpha/beta fold hydrolase [Phycisphaerae bacterium]